MIYPYDFHVHTLFCDGRNTPEQMVQSAIKNNLLAIGFSGHSYTEFDNSYAMAADDEQKYMAEITELKEKYRKLIEVFCGIEKDYYSVTNTADFDYCIGSVHYCYKNGEYVDVDLSAEAIIEAVERLYNGDYYLFVEDYFKNVSDVKNRTDCDIIGHFDLVTKFCEKKDLFSQNDKRFVNSAFCAVDELLKTDAVFEVNTGAMARGLRTTPYPSKMILQRILEKNGRIMLSGDAHSKETLCYKFSDTIEMLKSLGFTSLEYLTQTGFNTIAI